MPSVYFQQVKALSLVRLPFGFLQSQGKFWRCRRWIGPFRFSHLLILRKLEQESAFREDIFPESFWSALSFGGMGSSTSKFQASLDAVKHFSHVDKAASFFFNQPVLFYSFFMRKLKYKKAICVVFAEIYCDLLTKLTLIMLCIPYCTLHLCICQWHCLLKSAPTKFAFGIGGAILNRIN